jgi:hypothetical protein
MENERERERERDELVEGGNKRKEEWVPGFVYLKTEQ